MRLTLAVLAVAAAAAAAVPAGDGAGTAFCTGSQLRGSFAVVPGSAGAGNIVYALRVTNRSARRCALTGLPAVRLLGRAGKPLPTHVVAAFPGALTAVLVTLAPGRSAGATARFSPDVPGVGEGNRSRCEPVAYRLRVLARGGGSTVAAVRPPTPVCEHGRLQFRAYGPAR
ncbi:MAG TPA: DUF4232 domain-containing protein [Gaiellaceae bacterium]|nr:DUF4232 domain-containing protein [Gaiellaceae bacterium]